MDCQQSDASEAAWTIREGSCRAGRRCRWQSMPTGWRGWGWGGSPGPFWCWPGQQCWSLSLCTGGTSTTSPTKSCSGGRPSTGRGPSSLAAARWRPLLHIERAGLHLPKSCGHTLTRVACSPSDTAFAPTNVNHESFPEVPAADALPVLSQGPHCKELK